MVDAAHIDDDKNQGMQAQHQGAVTESLRESLAEQGNRQGHAHPVLTHADLATEGNESERQQKLRTTVNQSVKANQPFRQDEVQWIGRQTGDKRA